MSTYNGRRGPNVSQYLRDLNAVNPQEPAEENYNMDEDLSVFTNTQFFDFETGQTNDYQAQPVKVDVETPPSATTSNDLTPAQSVIGDLTNLDFMQGEFWELFYFSCIKFTTRNDVVHGLLRLFTHLPIRRSLAWSSKWTTVASLSPMVGQGAMHTTNYTRFPFPQLDLNLDPIWTPTLAFPYPLCAMRDYHWDKLSRDAGSLKCGPLGLPRSILNG
ncbi:Fc.00g015430.m01.CDS01 [Cosmosporella sp. VM-42]